MPLWCKWHAKRSARMTDIFEDRKHEKKLKQSDRGVSDLFPFEIHSLVVESIICCTHNDQRERTNR